MKSLEEILKTGTESEKELARLCLSHPTDPKGAAEGYLTLGLLACTLSGGITAGCIYGITKIDNLALDIVAGVVAAASGLFTAVGATGVYQTIKQWRESLAVPPQKKTPLDEAVFYIHNGGFTCNPSLAETTLGHRVYPIDEPSHKIPELSPGDRLFIGRAILNDVLHFGDNFRSSQGTEQKGEHHQDYRIGLTFRRDDKTIGKGISLTYLCPPEKFQIELLRYCDGSPRNFLFQRLDVGKFSLDSVYPVE